MTTHQPFIPGYNNVVPFADLESMDLATLSELAAQGIDGYGEKIRARTIDTMLDRPERITSHTTVWGKMLNRAVIMTLIHRVSYAERTIELMKNRATQA